jgi:hypothetical protein
MKLTKTKHTTKDNRGCEFPYEIYTSWEFNDLPPNQRFNEIKERIYYQPWYDLKADTLSELKQKMDRI